MQKRYYQEFASITPTYTSFYVMPLEKYYNKKKILPKPKIVRADNRSIKRLQKALYYMIITSPIQTTYCKIEKKHVRFRLNFITLTIANSKDDDDKFIKANLLDRFLKWIVYKGATGYIWKAETQKRGTLHFHIVTNKYIHWRDIRSYWNALQQRFGYLDTYFANNGHYDSNSTDVHAIKQETKALKYMSKYMIKEQTDRRKVDGHNFGYSRNLANIKITMESTSKQFEEIYNYLHTKDSYTAKFDFVTVLCHPIIDLKKCPVALSDLIINSVKKRPRKSANP